jgi:hypothetical protein
LVSANDNQDDLLDKILDRGGAFPPRTSSTNALNS